MPLETECVRHPSFWSSQFARTDASRRWLVRRRSPAERLTWEEVIWVLGQRGGHTLLFRRAGGASGALNFEIRSGKVVSIAEMFYYGSDWCTACDICKLYLHLPIVIHRRQRPVSRRRRDE